MTVTIGILIGSSSQDDKWKDEKLIISKYLQSFQNLQQKMKKGGI